MITKDDNGSVAIAFNLFESKLIVDALKARFPEHKDRLETLWGTGIIFTYTPEELEYELEKGIIDQ
jgi:hypothetical protein